MRTSYWIVAATLSLFFSGCNPKLRDVSAPSNVVQTQELIRRSKEQAYDYTLAEKASVFENIYPRFLLPDPFNYIPITRIRKKEKKYGSVSELYRRLQMESLKYAHSQDASSLET